MFDVVLTQIDGKDVIRVIVSCGQQRPYYLRKKGMTEQGCFICVGSSAQPMSEQMIEELIAERQQLTLQSMTSPRQNLTFKQLCIYYEEKNLEPTDRSIFEISPSFTVVKFPFEEAFITQHDKINDKINSTIDLLKYNPTATIPDLVEVTGKSQSTISRELREYQKTGLLRREGSRKTGRWVVE